jgi:hypothetical protein
MENSTNAFHKNCTYDNKDVCAIHSELSQRYQYATCLYQHSKTPPLPEATWGIRIVAVWNKAAREQPITIHPGQRK